MDINDHSPERRNLIVASMSFIIFYSAGGALSNNEVTLMFMSVSFSRPYVIGIFAWVMLAWFCLRFWQKFGFQYWDCIHAEIRNGRLNRYFDRYARAKALNECVKKFGDNGFDKNLKLALIEIHGCGMRVVYSTKHGERNGAYIFDGQADVVIDGFLGVLLLVAKTIYHSIKDNAFAEHFVPYFLFVLAITGPLWSAD